MLKVLVTGLTLAYPFVVFLGLSRFPPGVFGALLALLILIRMRAISAHLKKTMTLGGYLIIGYAALIVWLDSERLLRLYPVLINLLVFMLFASTLLSPPSMIEHISRRAGMEVPPSGVAYTHKLTLVWCVFFLINAAAAGTTAIAASRATWALYNGFISYVLMGLLFGAEYLYRQHYKRQHSVNRP